MDKRIKKKMIIVFASIVVCMFVVAQIVFEMQKNISLSNCKTEIQQQAARLPELLNSAKSEYEQNTQTYDAVFQSKADSIVFIANNNAGFEASNSKMQTYKELLEVDNIFIVDRQGNIQASSGSTQADFKDAKFGSLKTVLDGKSTRPLETTYNDKTYRYYASAVNNQNMFVIEQDPTELKSLNEQTSTEASVLSDITVGNHGYVMSVSGESLKINYHPNSEISGRNVEDLGIGGQNLNSNDTFECRFAGEDVFCGTLKLENNYYVFVVPQSDMWASRTIAIGVILFVLFVIMLAISLYGIFILIDDTKKDTVKKLNAFGPYCINLNIAKRALILSIVGFFVIVGVCFYMQTLFALSSQSVINNQRVAQVSNTIKQTQKNTEDLKTQYNKRYLDKCRVAAHVVSKNPSLANHDKLVELAKILQIAAVYVIDGTGNMQASSTALKSYSLSTNPSDDSYAFRALLAGKEELVQPMSHNDSTGEAQQFIGVATYSSDGYANGLVQIAVRPQRLEGLLKSVKIDNVLSGIKAGADGFAFAVNQDTKTIEYYPDSNIQGKTAQDVGISDAQLKDGYTDYITIGTKKYFATCSAVNNYFLFIAGSEGELMSEREPLTLSTGLIALVCLLFVFIVLSFELKRNPQEEISQTNNEGRNKKKVKTKNNNNLTDNKSTNWRIFDVTMANGYTKKTESAVSRWFYRRLNWNEKTPEQKLGTVFKWFIGLAAFIVCLSVVFKSSIFPQNSVIAYILTGNWTRGLNIFAVTASIMYACVAITISSIIIWILQLLSSILGTRGETFCRLLSSGIKYGTVIFMIYWCLGVLGVDTGTLLASAGIITLALSFGAKDLVSDILCGFFIIIEGEFRVGDVIQVGSHSGTVVDIGIRTTKIKNTNGNVLVLRNSSISNVINKTKLDSYAKVDIILPTGESLTYLENLLSRELKHVAARVPEIIDGPFYKGVVELAETTITVRVVATCKEHDKGNLERSLKREMKILLAHGGVKPFADVEVHEPLSNKTDEQRKKEKHEQNMADKYLKQQKEATQSLGNEDSGGKDGE